MKYWWIFFIAVFIVFACGNTLEEETSQEITIPDDEPIVDTNSK